MAKTVLLIDDNSDFRNVVRLRLEKEGYRVLDAATAKEGMSLAVQEKPDVILMDIRLPSKKRGIGTARLLRARPETKNTPIIFVTGYIEGVKTKEVTNIPNTRYVTKPFDFAELIKEIEGSSA